METILIELRRYETSPRPSAARVLIPTRQVHGSAAAQEAAPAPGGLHLQLDATTYLLERVADRRALHLGNDGIALG